MAKCPSCGVDNPSSVKSWPMVGKPSKSGEMLKLTIGLYKCCNCGKSFRYAEGKEKITMKGILDRSNLLEEKLMEATKKRAELEERVLELENEKACLCAEIEALKVIPVLEEKASSLEYAISRLREEKETLLKKDKDLIAEGAPAFKENPLEAYIAEPAPEVQSSGVETLIAEPMMATTAADVVSMETVEVAVTGVPCEAAIAEAPIVEEKPVENLHAEPVVTDAVLVDVPGPEPVPIEEASAVITAPESYSTSIDESATVEHVLSEPTVVESPTEVPVIKEKLTETPQVETLTNIVVAPETLTTEKPVETPTNETVLEEKSAETPLTVTTPEVIPVEAALPDVKLDEAKVIESSPGETPTIATPSSEPIVEVTTVTDKPVEAPPLEVTPSETPPIPKVEVQLTDTPATVVASAELPTEDVDSPTPQVTVEIIVTTVADVTPMVEPKLVEKTVEIIQPSVVKPVQIQSNDAPKAEVIPVLVAQPETQIPEAIKVEVFTQVEKLEDKPVIEDKPV